MFRIEAKAYVIGLLFWYKATKLSFAAIAFEYSFIQLVEPHIRKGLR